MSLADHLRELRWRLVASLVVIVLGMIVCAFFYDPLTAILLQPLRDAKAQLAVTNPGLDIKTTISDVTAPFIMALKVVGLAGLVVTCPFWLYQAWAYIVPALVAQEKKLALLFIGAAVPLFLFGIAAAYWVLPQGIVVMLQFTPGTMDITNMLDINNFLNLLLQMMVVFGIGFLIPVFVVALNLVGILPAAALAKARTYVVFGCFVFAAAATPGSDPFSMMALALPMALLFFGAELICRVNDRRRAKRAAAVAA